MQSFSIQIHYKVLNRNTTKKNGKLFSIHLNDLDIQCVLPQVSAPVLCIQFSPTVIYFFSSVFIISNSNFTDLAHGYEYIYSLRFKLLLCHKCV